MGRDSEAAALSSRRLSSNGRPLVVLSANNCWNLAHFRSGLTEGLDKAGFRIAALAPLDAHAEELNRQGIDVWDVPIARSGVNPLADARLLFRYVRLLRKLRPAAYCGFTIKPNVYGAIAARIAGVPALVNITGLGTVFISPGPLTWLVMAMYRFALRRSEVVFFQNPDDRDLFLEHRIVRPEQARLIPGDGVDLERFSSAPFPGGEAKFLLVGRLLADKGVREFVEAARIIRTSGDARFQLLGALDEGNRTSVTRAELDTWVTEGTIEYLGSAADVRPFIERSTAIVLPSYREGLPRTLLEGAAMARPLIATNVPGCREVVEHGVEGFLCEARSAQSLAAAMRKFLDMGVDQRRDMGLAARRKVEKRFDETIVIRAYLDELAALEHG